MTTWTISVSEKDGRLINSVVETRCEGGLLKAVLTSRKLLWYLLNYTGQNMRNAMAVYSITITASDHPFVYCPTFHQNSPTRNRLKWIDISFKNHSPNSSYRIGKSLAKMIAIGIKNTNSIHETHFISSRDENSSTTIVLDHKHARRLRQRLRENYVDTKHGLKYSTDHLGITFGSLLSMLGGPYAISDLGHVTFEVPSLFKAPVGDSAKNHPLVTDMVVTLLDHPTFINNQVGEPPRRRISPTREVFKWLAENNIDWNQNGDGFELVSDEDYTLYKVLFE